MTLGSRRWPALAIAVGLAAFIPSRLTSSAAQQPPAGASVAIDADDIGGVVTGPGGPEAGVWVIAETHDLPVRYIKIVVTDDQGRYVIPDLPRARYDVWVRGYGLVDSAKSASQPGAHVNFSATARADAGRCGALLPRDLLVFDAAHPHEGRDGRARGIRRQHDGAAMARRRQESGLRRLPSARPALDADHSGVARHVRVRRGRVAPPRAVGSGRRDDVRPVERAGRRRRSSTTATGPIASRKASCRTASRAGPRAPNATSSSRCATG